VPNVLQVTRRHRVLTGILAVALLSLLLRLAAFADRKIVRPTIYGDVTKVEIIDGGGRKTNPDVALLNANVTSSDQTAANAIRDAALAAFPSGSWQNFGPDASYRSIRITCRKKEIRLDSWHPLFETDPQVVVGSHGVTSLGAKTRAEYLRSDDQRYVAKRNAFDGINQRLMERFSQAARNSAGPRKGRN
jgi:hypothetical protein